MPQHVLVTGAGSGIGREIALTFAGEGAELTLADIQPDALALTAEEAEFRSEAPCHQVITDLADPGAPEVLIEAAWKQQPVDALISSAGIYPATPFLELDSDVWDTIFAVNARAPVLLTSALSRRVIHEQRHASIVNISSGAAIRARPGAAPYSASKAALEAATKASALELGKYGIRVNAVAPGFVTVESSVNPVSEEYAEAVRKTPLGRDGRPADVACAVQWLTSEAASWITGEVLRVDGGASTGAWTLPPHWKPRGRPGREEEPA